MGIMSGFFGNTSSSESGYGDSHYSDDELLGAYRDLSYQECKNIYRYWPLGKRIASQLPNFAMSAPREIIVKDAPSAVIEQFNKTADSVNLDKQVRKCSIYARIYGLAAMFVACENVKSSDNLTQKDVINNRIVFNVLDPLNISSVRVEQDASSLFYQKVKQITINGNDTVGSKRATVVFNDIPLYLKFNPSTFSFSGASVYQNMTGLIKSWNRSIVSLERMATKAGSIIVKGKDRSHTSGLTLGAINKNLELIRNMQNDGIANIGEGEVEFFQLSGIQEVDSLINSLNTSLMMALSDTPSAILLDKNLSNGFNDGSEDMKAIIMAVDNFRKLVLSPLYDFADPFIMYKAWDDEFVEQIKADYPNDYRGLSNVEIVQQWTKGFSFNWGNLYPEPEKDKIETNSARLDLLTKAKELGANLQDIQEELNSLEIFGNDMELSEKYIEDFDSDSDEDTADEDDESYGEAQNDKESEYK